MPAGARVERIVLLPRHTALVGLGAAQGSMEFAMPPVNARAYARADITAWGFPGNPDSVPVLEESPDLVTWSENAALERDGVTSVDLDAEWIRLRVTVDETVVLTGWVVGDFTLRESG